VVAGRDLWGAPVEDDDGPQAVSRRPLAGERHELVLRYVRPLRAKDVSPVDQDSRDLHRLIITDTEEPNDRDLTLAPFEDEHADVVLSWIGSADELEAWASRRDFPLRPETLRDWHRDPDVHPHVLLAGGVLCAYGEVWEDRAEDEAELARIVVDPAQRGRGLGRELVRRLTAEAEAMGFRSVWMRVVPWNKTALASYAGAGFVRAAAEEEERFNRGQPHPYVWLRNPQSPAR
jgi:[ribosomal protein S18]-alanine N-acetyltransferase